MVSRIEPFIPYNKRNLNRVSKSILKHLTPDLLPKKYLIQNKKNKFYGHCHNASGCLYMFFRSQNVPMYRAYDDSLKLVNEPMYHWFILNRHTNVIIDITSEQYSSHPKVLSKLYKNKEKAGLLGFKYKKRVHTLLKRVKSDLKR